VDVFNVVEVVSTVIIVFIAGTQFHSQELLTLSSTCQSLPHRYLHVIHVIIIRLKRILPPKMPFFIVRKCRFCQVKNPRSCHNCHCQYNWMSEWVSEWVSEWMNERMSEWLKQRVSEWMSEWMNEWMNEWINVWVNDWSKEWVNEWMNEWMNECVIHTWAV